MSHSIAPIPPARYPSIPNKPVIFFHILVSEIVPDTIIFTPLFLHHYFEAPALQAALALPAKRGGFPVFSASHNADHSRSLPP